MITESLHENSLLYLRIFVYTKTVSNKPIPSPTMATTVKNKVDWRAVAQKITQDKKRIEACKNTDQEHLINDIPFISPAALQVRESRG